MRFVVAVLMLCTACAPAHMRTLWLSGSDREVSELFLGGWNGRALGAFNDVQLEPGVTRRDQVLQVLKGLSRRLYAVAWVDHASLDASAGQHALFCDAPQCLVVFERNGASEYAGWGEAVAVFELSSAADGPIGPIWLAARAIRPPGHRKWDLLCQSKQEPPRYVHPEGNALYPARPEGRDGFALFGAPAAEAYRRGFPATNPSSCEVDRAGRAQDQEPERPPLKLDPGLLRRP